MEGTNHDAERLIICIYINKCKGGKFDRANLRNYWDGRNETLQDYSVYFEEGFALMIYALVTYQTNLCRIFESLYLLSLIHI